MKVAVIYRPRAAPPPEAMGTMLDAMRQWLESHSGRFEQVHFFVGGGGFGVADVQDSTELMRISAENPFTPYSDVEVRPVVEADSALAILQEALAATAR